MDNTKSRALACSTDPSTSKDAAEATAPRTGSIKYKLLLAYYVSRYSITDREASSIAEVHEGWKRCADLRNDGYIEPLRDADGKLITVDGGLGHQVMLCRITSSGRSVIE